MLVFEFLSTFASYHCDIESMKKVLILGWLCAFFNIVAAQDNTSWATYYEQLSDLESVESESWEQGYELLDELSQHPIDLNHATREDLEQLFFLSSQQVEELVEYIDKYAPIHSLGELAMIESLDYNRRKLLSFFVTIGDDKNKLAPTISDILKYGNNELILTAKIPFYERKGDQKGYLGYPYKHWAKYTFSYGQQVKAGLVASQDGGEPWFAGQNKWGYDYYSYYLQLKNFGNLKSLVAGRYRLKFGLGLAINRDFGFGKIATLSSLGNTSNTIRAHSSRSEANYLQGAAATVRLIEGLDLTGFVSSRKIDGTLSDDSTSISTIVESGYHRTLTEMGHKHNTSQWMAGGHVQYFTNGFHVGLTGLSSGLDRELCPNTNQLYRKYYPSGKQFWNLSADYGYISRRLSIQGETATSDSKALATINTVSYQCTSTWSFTAIQRFYSYKYYSLFSQGFSDGGHIQNESGMYLGLQWQPLKLLSLMAYVDYAYHPWATYYTSFSSNAWDYFLQGEYQSSNWRVQARYRLQRRQKDNNEKTALINENTHRGRISVEWNNGSWVAQAQTDLAYCLNNMKSFGYLLSTNVGYQHKDIQVYANVGYFYTDNYNSRLYTYERGMLYSFSFPVFSGEGVHGAMNLRWDVNNSWMLMAKLSSTHYLDRKQIGSSYQMIDGNTQTDIEIQARVRF